MKKDDSRVGSEGSRQTNQSNQPNERDDSSDMLSDAYKTSVNDSFQSQQYNLSSRQKQLENGANFKTLAKISEQDKIEIIKTGFRLNQEGKISLKKYYVR